VRGIAGLVLVCAACAEGALAPDAALDAPSPRPDAPLHPDAPPPDAPDPMPGFFVDDSADDFAGGSLDAAVIEPWGAIAPAAFYTGGLRLRASDTGVFSNATTATWAQVAAMPLTAAVVPGRTLWTGWGAGTPAGVGLTDGNDFTLVYDGEILLEAGTWTFHVLADDHAFLEIAPLGTAAFQRVASANWPSEATGTFVAAAAGWHPVRLAYVERSGEAQLRVEMSGPLVPVRAPVSRHRLRFAAGDLAGLLVAGFAGSRLLGEHAASVDAQAPAARDWGTGRPADLGLTSNDHFSVRWSGQLRIDVAGDYAFRYVSDDGQRLWIDGVRVLDHWDDTVHDETTAAIPLAPGWHDLVVDHSEATGAAQARLGVAAGPDLVGDALPVERLRPIETRRARYETGVDRTSYPIPDRGRAEARIRIDAPPGAKVAGVDVGWTFEHTYHGDLEIRLVAPDGSVVVLRDHEGGAAAGTVTQRLHTAALDEAGASGVWILQVDDTISLDTGWLRAFQLTVHHRAGQPPIPATATFTSAGKDLGAAVTAYHALSWQARLAPGTAVRLRARSADAEAELADEPWSTPLVDPGGGPPPVPARRWFQYRIELSSDGDGSAIVDWVRLDYQTEEDTP
jgi:subtilisin-like proprotein convertase family protein